MAAFLALNIKRSLASAANANLRTLLKNPFGVLRRAQDERGGVDIAEKNPCMLTLSKHSALLSATCWAVLVSSAVNLFDKPPVGDLLFWDIFFYLEVLLGQSH